AALAAGRRRDTAGAGAGPRGAAGHRRHAAQGFGQRPLRRTAADPRWRFAGGSVGLQRRSGGAADPRQQGAGGERRRARDRLQHRGLRRRPARAHALGRRGIAGAGRGGDRSPPATVAAAPGHLAATPVAGPRAARRPPAGTAAGAATAGATGARPRAAVEPAAAPGCGAARTGPAPTDPAGATARTPAGAAPTRAVAIAGAPDGRTGSAPAPRDRAYPRTPADQPA